MSPWLPMNHSSTFTRHTSRPQKPYLRHCGRSQSAYLVRWIPRCHVGRGQLWIISARARPHLGHRKERDTSCLLLQVKSNPITEISTCLSNLFPKLLRLIHHWGPKGETKASITGSNETFTAFNQCETTRRGQSIKQRKLSVKELFYKVNQIET